jgi:hypothetical protein
MVGIECDGAMYHSSAVARDRDRLREQVLEGLGWKIIHVWSTDWYRNREETQKKLLNAIGVSETEASEIITNGVLEEELEEINDLAGNLEELGESNSENNSEINSETQNIEIEPEIEVSMEETGESEIAIDESAEESINEKSENDVLIENGIKLSSSELDSAFEVQSSYANQENINSEDINSKNITSDINSEKILSDSDISGNVKTSDHISSIDSDAEIQSSELGINQPLSSETDL